MFRDDSTNKDRDIFHVIESVEALIPGVKWTQLKVNNPDADDDGIWFFWLQDKPGDVQLASSTGMLPFLAETDKHDKPVTCITIEGAADIVSDWLRLPGGNTSGFWYTRT